ncbi:protein kinase domain protein [Ancylostoma caninum]|uniref:Protein kinase domain protein n=1 Tax=Ancylostoma caninum TaxID=29170 RepID=A0A368GL33_ANCCA|nr:protein kinase domain protein [Ancylostoma caninum]
MCMSHEKGRILLNYGTLIVEKKAVTNCDEDVKSPDDVSNFDSEFTHEIPRLTPIDRLFLMNLDQTEFNGFSYVNPEYVQEL